MGEIIVGVDGSTEAQHALQWALTEAVVRGAGVRAVHAFEIPIAYTGYHAGGVMVSPDLAERAQDDAERLLEDLLTKVEVPRVWRSRVRWSRTCSLRRR
jgi:nucleotide-binding universal stress UspA family protein